MESSQNPSPNPDRLLRAAIATTNERTFLAWVRTGGWPYRADRRPPARMGVFLRQLAMMSGAGPHREFRGSHEFLITGVVFLILGTALCIAANGLYNRACKAIDANRYEPPRHAVLILTLLVAAGSVTITALVLWQLVAVEEK